MKKTSLSIITATIIISLLIYTQITIFVLQPIGALPNGVTIIMLRKSNLNFVDSADSMCERAQGGVSLFCRISALKNAVEGATIIARLPYLDWVYKISTNGKVYEN